MVSYHPAAIALLRQNVGKVLLPGHARNATPIKPAKLPHGSQTTYSDFWMEAASHAKTLGNFDANLFRFS
jgi:hypothetical protein